MTAQIIEIDGKLVLDDPDARGALAAVARHNCDATYAANRGRIDHFRARIRRRGDLATNVVVVINVDDVHGGPLAASLMPSTDWQLIRDRGQVPYARGLAGREGMQGVLNIIDSSAADDLRSAHGTAVIVVDFGVVCVYSEVSTTASQSPASSAGSQIDGTQPT